MSTGVRVSWAEASIVADELAGEFAHVTERVSIAGSLRRKRPDVGDIELVAIPTIETVEDGMFDTRTVNRLFEWVDYLIEVGTLASHPDDPKRGERYSKLLHPASGLQVDLFSTTVQSWGILYLIRTGPATYSRQFVTDLRRRGLHVGNATLHRGGLGCGEYVCEVVPTPEETDVYAAAGWPFVKPELRA